MATYSIPTKLKFTHNLYNDKTYWFVPVPEDLTVAENYSNYYIINKKGGIATVTLIGTTEPDGISRITSISNNSYSLFTNKATSSFGSITIPNPFSLKSKSANAYVDISTSPIECTLDEEFSLANEDTITLIKDEDGQLNMNVNNDTCSKAIYVGNGSVQLYDNTWNDNMPGSVSGITNVSISDNTLSDGTYTFSIGGETYQIKVGEISVSKSTDGNYHIVGDAYVYNNSGSLINSPKINSTVSNITSPCEIGVAIGVSDTTNNEFSDISFLVKLLDKDSSNNVTITLNITENENSTYTTSVEGIDVISTNKAYFMIGSTKVACTKSYNNKVLTLNDFSTTVSGNISLNNISAAISSNTSS